VKNKFWNHVETRLLLEDSLYYAGGTLCIDFEKGGVAMNLNGKGFIYGGRDKFRQNSQVYLPSYITDMVRKIYLRVNGETEHFRREVSAYAG
jgi:hypothetical protein